MGYQGVTTLTREAGKPYLEILEALLVVSIEVLCGDEELVFQQPLQEGRLYHELPFLFHLGLCPGMRAFHVT